MSTATLPNHLGGHLNKVHTDRDTLLYLKEKYNIKTMIDIGCGPGDMIDIANLRGINAIGIDGDYTLQEDWEAKNINVILHDFSVGPPTIEQQFDLGWSIEFLEHVEEKYLPNFMSVFQKCNYVICTAAPPGQKGHHHVNLQNPEYWHKKFSEYGFVYDEEETKHIKSISGMRKPFIKMNGMFFRKE